SEPHERRHIMLNNNLPTAASAAADRPAGQRPRTDQPRGDAPTGNPRPEDGLDPDPDRDIDNDLGEDTDAGSTPARPTP
ncbi:MAG TPA: hypothetical protein VIU87_03610, partial [Mycobacterium sp.]